MYTVAADVLLKMTRVEPHEMLKAATPWSQDRGLVGRVVLGVISALSSYPRYDVTYNLTKSHEPLSWQAEKHLPITSTKVGLHTPHMNPPLFSPSRPPSTT